MTPLIFTISARMSASTSAWMRDRSAFGSSFTNTEPSSTTSPSRPIAM